MHFISLCQLQDISSKHLYTPHSFIHIYILKVLLRGLFIYYSHYFIIALLKSIDLNYNTYFKGRLLKMSLFLQFSSIYFTVLFISIFWRFLLRGLFVCLLSFYSWKMTKMFFFLSTNKTEIVNLASSNALSAFPNITFQKMCNTNNSLNVLWLIY